MNRPNDARELFTGQHLSMLARGHWEFVVRNVGSPGVGIVAITADDKIVLVRQHRLPVGCDVVELPAGLAGDLLGEEDEPLLEAAKRELLEETGYVANEWRELVQGFSSPGLTNESIVLFLAKGLERVHAGGGDAGEQITVHEIPIGDVLPWLEREQLAADLKLLAGLYLAARHVR